MRPEPPALAPDRPWGPDEPTQSIEHLPMPQAGVAAQVAALPDQPVGIPDVLRAQQVRLGRRPILYLGELPFIERHD